MTNITIELCAEDRARLDKLNERLEALIDVTLTNLDKEPKAKQAELNDPVEAPKNAQEEPKATDHPTLDPFPETPTPKEEPSEAPAKEAKPDVTMEMLRGKAITLAAAGKKDQVRDVVHPYAPKVTELPEDKWAEVYEKLTALEV